MTLLRFDGFELDDLLSRWTATGSPTTTTTNARFSGSRCASLSNADLIGSFTASAETFVGFALKRTAGDFSVSLRGDAGATSHVTLNFLSTGNIEARRGTATGTLLATATAAFNASEWNYFEVRATVADAGGVVQVRVNGTATNVINFSGDTKNAGTNTTLDTVRFISSTVTNTGLVDDVYVLNALGSAPHNTWLGDVRVYTLSPNGNGNSSQFTGSDGNSTDNYLLVDELPPSSADYVGSATVGHKDLYTMSNLPSGVGTIFGTNECLNAAKSDAGAASIKHLLRTASTDYNGAATSALTTGYLTYVNLRTVNPNTSAAWTTSEIDGLEVGIENA